MPYFRIQPKDETKAPGAIRYDINGGRENPGLCPCTSAAEPVH